MLIPTAQKKKPRLREAELVRNHGHFLSWPPACSPAPQTWRAVPFPMSGGGAGVEGESVLPRGWALAVALGGAWAQGKEAGLGPEIGFQGRHLHS